MAFLNLPGAWACLLVLLSVGTPVHAATTVLWREDFESIPDTLDRWTIQGGGWFFGKPTVGPRGSHLGINCAGTSLSGTYTRSRDSRLIRDLTFVVPAASEYPRLRFWHWMDVPAGDTGQVEIVLSDGSSEPLSMLYTNSSTAWTRPVLDLRKYSGLRVSVAFRFRSNNDALVATGWYVDDIECVQGESEFDLVSKIEFMDRIGDWTVENGSWEFGVPSGSGGPPAPFSLGGCAATILSGPYNAPTDSRLITPEFKVPEASLNPRLHFWHWFNFGTLGTGAVEIRSHGGDWKPVSTNYYRYNRSWTRATIDLKEYAGDSVEVAFRARANSNSQSALGWYLDDLRIALGPPVLDQPEHFEKGMADWRVEGGNWQIGVPSRTGPGPTRAHAGSACAGTVLAGSYDPDLDSRLISPRFRVEPAERHPRIHFWSWHEIGLGDIGSVEIREAGSGEWVPLRNTFTRLNRLWSRSTIDLRGFGGREVELAFRMRSNSGDIVGAGWYIDSLEWVTTGSPDWDPTGKPDGFEDGLGDWVVEGGLWQAGLPPASPGRYSGLCVGTVLDGPYEPGSESRLISPPFVVPGREECPELLFRSWHQLAPGHSATVEVRRGEDGAWTPLGPVKSGWNTRWTRSNLPLGEYAGQKVQISFRLRAVTGTVTALGWYLDEVSVRTGCPCFTLVNRPEGFEDDLGHWTVEGGTWQVGAPRDIGPARAFLGSACAGTGLRSNYDAGIRSRLISPPFLVPCEGSQARLRFAHWHNLGAGDFASVEIYDESTGVSSQVAGPFLGAGGGEWNPSESVDLEAFAGKYIRVAFAVSANASATVGPGWYVDHVRVTAQLLDPGTTYQVTEVNIGKPLSFRVSPICPDVSLRLLAQSPAGARFESDLGLVTWVPQECDGPMQHAVVVAAVDPRNECVVLQSVTNVVDVLESNVAPTWLGDSIISIAATFPIDIDFKLFLFDPDCPPNILRCSLGEGAPAGVLLSDCRLTWTPTFEQASITNAIVIRVSDGIESAERAWIALERVAITGFKVEGDYFRFVTKGGSPGRRYHLLFTSSLVYTWDGSATDPASWRILETFVWPASERYIGQILLDRIGHGFLQIVRAD